MLFRNTIEETIAEKEILDTRVSEMLQRMPYFSEMGTVSSLQNVYDPSMINLFGVRLIFSNFDALWERFMNACDFHEVPARYGLADNSENSTVDMWPLRLKWKIHAGGGRAPTCKHASW
jgi:hypothetical protein